MIHSPDICKSQRMHALVAMGGNVPGRAGPPWLAMIHSVEAVDSLPQTRVVAVSGLWHSLPWGRLRQPPFFNAVMVLETRLSARELLRALLAVERQFGRRRGIRPWGPRALDLDLLDLGARVMRPVGMGRAGSARARRAWQARGILLPHPGLRERAFVLSPLADVAKDWRHPETGESVRALLARLPGKMRTQCRPACRGQAAQAWQMLQKKLFTKACEEVEMIDNPGHRAS